jgi:hypothetical protein
MSSAKFCFLCFLFLTIASFATCHFGVNHEISKIPPEVRAGMQDFDWVGVKWIKRGMILELTAIISLVAGLYKAKFFRSF